MTYEEFIKIITDLVAKDDEIMFQQKELERELREGKRNTIADEMIEISKQEINNTKKIEEKRKKKKQEKKKKKKKYKNKKKILNNGKNI